MYRDNKGKKTIMRRAKNIYILFVGIAIAVLPVLLLRDFTPMNELRYLSIADEALRNHTLFAFTNHGIPYADKPPLYIWIIMLCKWATGAHRMWLLSLFALASALGVAKVMDSWVKDRLDPSQRALAQLMLLTSGLFIGGAIMVRMDMMMCLFIVLALREFWLLYTDEPSHKRSRWLFPLFLFIAVFTKGPLGLLIPLCSTTVFLALSHNMRRFFHYWGWRTWSVLVALCAAWFGCVYAEGGRDYLYNLLVHQTVDRAVNSYHHKKPVWYYAISIWYSIAPWTPLVISTVIAALRRKMAGDDMERFFLSVGITTFVMLSLISSKLEIYLLPAIPFLVYAAALVLPELKDEKWAKASLAVPAAIFALALPGVLAAAFGLGADILRSGFIYASAAVLSAGGAVSLRLLWRDKRHRGTAQAVAGLGASFLAAVFIAAWDLPKLNGSLGYNNLCRETMELSRKYGITDIRAWRISRPENMDVYFHHDIDVVRKEDDPMFGKDKPFLLMTYRKDTKDFPHQKSKSTGRYAVIVVRPSAAEPLLTDTRQSKEERLAYEGEAKGQ